MNLDVEQRALSLAERAGELATLTRETYEQAGPFLSGVKALEQEIQAHYAPLKKAAHETHRKIVAAERDQLAPLVAAETTVKRAICEYEDRIERERRALQQQVEEAAAIDGLDVVPVVSLPKVTTTGVSTRETWSVEVVDVLELVKAVADGRAPLALVLPNEAALNKLAGALKSAFSVPGCRAVSNRIVSAKAAH